MSAFQSSSGCVGRPITGGEAYSVTYELQRRMESIRSKLARKWLESLCSKVYNIQARLKMVLVQFQATSQNENQRELVRYPNQRHGLGLHSKMDRHYPCGAAGRQLAVQHILS